MRINVHDKQQGAVLIISLMLLLVLTTIGVSALSTTNIGERLAHNFQHAALVFQAAESAIEKVIISGDRGGAAPNDNPFYDEDHDHLLTAINAGPNDTSTVATDDMDPNDYLKSTTLNTSAIIVYIGEGGCPGSSFEEVVCYIYDIQSSAVIGSTSTRTTHVQTVERPAPKLPS